MSAKLSRYVARLMDTPVMVALSLEERNNMARAVEAAKSIKDLDKKYQATIQEAERQAVRII